MSPFEPSLPDDLEPAEHPYQVMVWHDVVHERLEGARLTFFRLSFIPSYDRERIFSTLEQLYEKLGITSHIAYETLGQYDLLLRLWVPSRFEPEVVELEIWEVLRDLRLWNINHFRGRTVEHPAQGPAPNLDERIEDEWIQEVNEFNRLQGQFEAVPTSPAIDSLVESHWISSLRTDARGIRFFVTFDHPAVGFTPPQRDAALTLIQSKVHEIENRWTDVENVTPPRISIYSGHGTMTDFLLMARAPHPRFHAFIRELVLGLRETQLGSLYAIRPYTHVMADRMFSRFSEQRAVNHAQKIDPDEDESESLEYKATFSIDARKLIAAGRHERVPERIAAVTRGACGMLNAPDGGRLIIGILEVQREIGRHKDPAPYLARLKELFDYDPLEIHRNTPPGRLPNAVIGVEAETGKGKPYADADVYLGRVAEALRSRIDPNPMPWLRVRLEEIEGRTLCVITARPSDRWFYVRSEDDAHYQFVVREAASTREYAGALGDSYKRAHPRG